MIRLLVTDTGPVLSLIAIDKFWLLERLYPDYYMPPTVFKEISLHLPRFTVDHIAFPGKFKARVLKPEKAWVEGLGMSKDLDRGELECNVLAKNGQYLLSGRRCLCKG